MCAAGQPAGNQRTTGARSRPAQGATVLLLCGSRELPARDLISTDAHRVSARAGPGSTAGRGTQPGPVQGGRRPGAWPVTRGAAPRLAGLRATAAPAPTTPTPGSPQDYLYLHREHNDWVTQLHFIPEIGLVTSSLDTTIKVG